MYASILASRTHGMLAAEHFVGHFHFVETEWALTAWATEVFRSWKEEYNARSYRSLPGFDEIHRNHTV